MNTEETRGQTFDGVEAAEQTEGQVADVSGIQRDRPGEPQGTQDVEQPDQPNEAAQIIP